MAIMILGVCVVAIGSGIALSVTISAVHRNQATAQDSLRNYAETLQNSYTPCTATSTPNYATSLVAPPGFAAPTVVVDYWVPATAIVHDQSDLPGRRRHRAAAGHADPGQHHRQGVGIARGRPAEPS